MSTTARAIVTNGDGKFYLDTIEIGDPESGEILVEIKASGVCHTDFDHMGWGKREVMGHEGAGVALACGPGVDHIRPGDRVLLNWAIPCGECFQCRRGAENICENQPTVPEGRVRCNGAPIGASLHLGTMATHAIVPKQAAVRIDVDIPFPSAAILGCGVMTGFGSAVNAAKVEKGSSVVVLGAGGVGLSVIQGAVYAGAPRVIAVDLNPHRLEMARQFGATDVLLAEREDAGLRKAAAKVRELTERGADYSFECTAVPELGPAPLAMVRNGGVAVGVSGIEQVVSIDMELFEWDKRYINPLYGQCRPFVDFPFLLSLYSRGGLKLDEMVTRTYPLADLGQAFEHMRHGLNAKGVLIPNA
jgi:S-(hydroxymethyl)glutathione dehydrogenase/alcohol dehydrogenase